MINTYPRETDEYQRFTVLFDGAPVDVTQDGADVAVLVGGVKAGTVLAAIVPSGQRPTDWATPLLDDENHAVVEIAGLTPGTWHVWTKVTTDSEKPVRDCGPFCIT